MEIRFIEFMPFGGNRWDLKKLVPYAEMLKSIKTKFPNFEPVSLDKNDVSKVFCIVR